MQKILLLTLLTFTMGLMHAQDTTFNFTINHVALSVKDVDQSSVFYQKTLHLKEITNRSKLEGVRWFSLGEGKELHLISILKENVVTNKAVHLALTTANFDALLARLDTLHVPYSDWAGVDHKINIRADGIKQIFFQDPDGYWIEVNSVAK